VIAVDPSQPAGTGSIGNGLQAVMRAMEICHLTHAHLRIETADVVLRPVFDRFVDVLDFGARRHCVAAGWAAARAQRPQLKRALLS
jgi:NTE family protein